MTNHTKNEVYREGYLPRGPTTIVTPREELLTATEARLANIAADVGRRTQTPLSADEIGVKVGKVINRHKTLIRFEQLTDPTPFQRHVFELLELKP